MKKSLKFLSLIGVSALLFACNNANNNGGDDPAKPIIPKEEGVLNINYLRDDNNYSSWALWVWADGKDGNEFEFTLSGDYGAICQIDLSDEYFKDCLDGDFGVIVKSKGSWDKKDVEEDRFFNLSSMTKEDGYYNMYLVTGDNNIYFDSSLVTLERISSAILTTDLKFKIVCSRPVKEYSILENNTVIHKEENINKTLISIKLTDKVLSVKNKYSVSVTFAESNKVIEKTITTSVLYNSDDFVKSYNYDGELGAIYTPSSTTFRVWSPVATSINLNLYENGTPVKVDSSKGSDVVYATYELEAKEKGIYEITVSGDLSGKYYTYEVFNNINAPSGVEVVDPYAKSTGVNGLRGMVVDFSKTNPENWEEISYLPLDNKELTVYETHIQDITSSSSWSKQASDLEYQKTFLGACLDNTSYTENNKTVTTGFAHIKELGVNAVQLLPIFDQDNDEKTMKFNWGYNPLNYNSLEGSYSTNPYDGYTRIKEFKTLVKEYNKAGIGIIMDVVYNHVSNLAKSNFNYLMPKYYYRYNGDAPTNGSGCGNETDSERYMFRKFMKDSTEFWMKEYKLSGFRFDLMGLHDLTTMKELSSNLKSINPYSTVYGEPWMGGSSPLSSSASAKQDNASSYEGYGAFNDKFRDALIRGGLSDKKERGWINNNTKVDQGDVNKILSGLNGELFINAANKVSDPNKNVIYVTCHDNYTLADRMEASEVTSKEEIKKMAMLANSMVFSSKGTTFMLAGEEFLRTKQGDSNSYQSSYEVNELDYSLKIKNADMFNNYKKLINYKQTNEVLHSDKSNSDKYILEASSLNNGSTIVVHTKDLVNNKESLVAFNNGIEGNETVDFSGYSLYLDTLNKENFTLSNAVKLEPYQTIIATK